MSEPRLVEWDEILLRLRGSMLEAMVQREVASRRVPIQEIHLTFVPGELRIDGKVEKFFLIPFRLFIRRIESSGGAIRIYLENISAFGLPIPVLLRKFAEKAMQNDALAFDAVNNVITVRLDRFLPTFLDVDVRHIEIIEGGIGVALGQGGADIPPGGTK
ncbi:MAG TPA: hypothetical protein VHL58_17225 [Thermoanaerobaculia bacterium]|nr:hypothetical protein [Thermoanaerobaculia bacterium]